MKFGTVFLMVLGTASLSWTQELNPELLKNPSTDTWPLTTETIQAAGTAP
jgi:hypothetical protein